MQAVAEIGGAQETHDRLSCGEPITRTRRVFGVAITATYSFDHRCPKGEVYRIPGGMPEIVRAGIPL